MFLKLRLCCSKTEAADNEIKSYNISIAVMKKIQQLKKILEKDDTEMGLIEFRQIMEGNPGLHVEDLNLLLRWAVTEQKKYFKDYYQILNKLGSNVNFIDTREKKSNLMIACQKSNIEIVEVLVSNPNINFKLEDVRKKNALYYAIDNKNKEKGEKIVRIILSQAPFLLQVDKNSKSNSTPLIAAIEKGRYEIVKTLLEMGADPNDQVIDNGNTPLHEAVKVWKSKPISNNQQIVQLLLENGADPSIQNKQNKNSIEMSEKLEAQFQEMVKRSKRPAIVPIVSINSPADREKVFDQAAIIFKDNAHLIRDPINTSLSNSDQDELSEEQNEPFELPQFFVESLNNQIHMFTQECINDYNNAQKELKMFMEVFEGIANSLNLYVQIYGSFATGLWLKHCDIDLLLIPKPNSPVESVQWYLDEVYMRLKQTSHYSRASILKSIKVPMIRIEFSDGSSDRKKNSRKFDITVMGLNHNGKQHAMYITRLMGLYSALQPLFYVIKKLSYYYKLNDPKNCGIRSYAIVLMLTLYLQEYHSDNLGELLLGFLYKFGYNYEYQYLHNEEQSMILNIPDPVSPKNNLGNLTDAASLQRMFKAGYIILHTKTKQGKLAYLFDSRNMFN